MRMWNRIRNGFARFMSGRHGADRLGVVTLWTAIILSLIGSFSKISLFSLLSLVLYGWTLYRMMSRNLVKRRLENEKFEHWYAPIATRARQSLNRLKMRRKFKYFRCPQCKSLLKLPRKVGEVTMTCGNCGHQFKQKA